MATISRDRRCVTLRHVWPNDVDGRVWNAIMRAVRNGARELAAKVGRDVEIFNKAGATLDRVYADER